MIDDTIPPELERIILRCLAKDIPERFRTAADLSADLTRWLSAATTAILPVQVAERASRRRQIALWVCAVAALAAASGLFFFGPSRKSVKEKVAAGPIPSLADERTLQSVQSIPHGPLSGDVNVLISSAKKGPRQGLSIHEPGALPLKTDDRIRVEAVLNRPAYLYLVWIASEWAGQSRLSVASRRLEPARKERADDGSSVASRGNRYWLASGRGAWHGNGRAFRAELPLPQDVDLEVDAGRFAETDIAGRACPRLARSGRRFGEPHARAEVLRCRSAKRSRAQDPEADRGTAETLFSADSRGEFCEQGERPVRLQLTGMLAVSFAPPARVPDKGFVLPTQRFCGNAIK